MNKVIAYEKDPVTGEPVAYLKGTFSMGDLVTLLSALEKQTGTMPHGMTTGDIEVLSVVSAETGEPIVELQSVAFDHPIQLKWDGALELGHSIIDAASQAICDAMVADFFMNKVQVSREQMAGMLYQFREYRHRLLSQGNEPSKE